MKKAVLFVSSCALGLSVSAQGAFEELRALKEGAPAAARNEGVPSGPEMSDTLFAACDESLRRRICAAIEGGREVLVCARLLADAQIVRSLSKAARRGAFVLAILENKISVSDYAVPEYLVKSSVPVYFPERMVRIGNDFVVVDRKSAYILPAWDFSAAACAFAVVCEGESSGAYREYLRILQHCEPSGATKLELPKSSGQIMERLK